MINSENKNTSSYKMDEWTYAPSRLRFIVLPIVYFFSIALMHITFFGAIERIGYNLTVKTIFITLINVLPLATFIFFMLMRFKTRLKSGSVLLFESITLIILPIISFLATTIIFGLILVCFFGISA